MSSTKIDSTAVIDPSAEIDGGVQIGPFAVIGPRVRIGHDTRIGPHCVIDGPTTIGANNHFIGQSSIGTAPQDYTYKGEPTELIIGDNNVVREFVTLNRGTLKESGITRIGSSNLIMAYCHVGHDCVVGSNITMGNGATLAGHVHVGDKVILGGLSAVHQFTHIGAYSIIGGGSLVSMDVVPYAKASGDHAKMYGTNIIGLRRGGFSPEEISNIQQAYRILFKEGLLLKDAVSRLRQDFAGRPEIERILDFLERSQRGITR